MHADSSPTLKKNDTKRQIKESYQGENIHELEKMKHQNKKVQKKDLPPISEL